MITHRYGNIPLSKLTLTENNPRYIGGPEFERLKRSLSKKPEWLKAKPLIVSERGNGVYLVLGGEMRIRAALELGWESIYCCSLSGLTTEEEAELLIKDNTHYGQWDYDALANEWSEYPGLDLVELGIPEYQMKGLPELSQDEKKRTETIKIVVAVSDKDAIIEQIEPIIKAFSGARIKS